MEPRDSPQRATLLRRAFELPVVRKLFAFHPRRRGRESFRPEAVQARLPRIRYYVLRDSNRAEVARFNEKDVVGIL